MIAQVSTGGIGTGWRPPDVTQVSKLTFLNPDSQEPPFTELSKRTA